MRQAVPKELMQYLGPRNKGISLHGRVTACELALIDVLARLSDLEAQATPSKNKKPSQSGSGR